MCKKHFNQFGYEGTKIAQIAEDAGIRKQSLSYKKGFIY
ncbi:transcriptional regulator, TetR family [Bacillus sp. OK048]|nr:transcriptional regulator, TetR family [Bacillus sp. OK048]